MSMDKMISALSFIQPTDRDLWVKIGMAVKSEFGEDGFNAWDLWSQSGETYNEKSAISVWRSFKAAGKVNIGTLFHEAAAHGWRDSGEHRGPLTAQEIEQKRIDREKREKAAAVEEARKQRGYREAAIHSQQLMDACKIKPHYYLNAKGLPHSTGLVTNDDVLVIPMRNAETNALHGVQTIAWLPDTHQWEKKMTHGMRAKGAVLRLGNARAKETFICEGYATGLSIEMALRQLRIQASVLICFSAGNLVHVAPMIKGVGYVVADNDKSLTGELSAKKTGLRYCMSDVLGEDANDYMQRAGLMALCAMLMNVRRM